LIRVVTKISEYRVENTVPFPHIGPHLYELFVRQRATSVRVVTQSMCGAGRRELENRDDNGQPDVGDGNLHLRESSWALPREERKGISF
jgi:hypothetical protein